MTIAEEDRRLAQHARTLWLQDGGCLPVDIGRIAVGFCFAFEYRRAPLGFHGALFAQQHLIIINACLSLCRQRYVIAHELAHWLVNRYQVPVRAARVERVCQLFAAHLLMPPERVAADARAGYGRANLLADLAADYLVTPSAMRIQLQQLGLFPGGALRTLEKELANQAKNAPVLIDIPGTTDDASLMVPIFTVDIDEVYRREMRDGSR